VACQRPLPTDMIESHNTYFYKGALSPSPNTKTVGELLVDFFRFYAFEFSYLQDCVSPRIGGMISRSIKGWEYNNSSTLRSHDGASCALCVEDPFILDRNCAITAKQWVVSGIRWEHERALRALLSGRGLAGAAAPWTPWGPTIYQKLNVYQPLK
jgi:terminal uridylyltransferase